MLQPAQIAERIGIYKAERARNGLAFDPTQIAVARQLYVAMDEADKQAALVRQAAYTKRTVDVSRKRQAAPAARMCWPIPTRPAAPRRTRFLARRTKLARCLEQLRGAGADYVLLTVSGGIEQLDRFARDIMPAFARAAPAADAAE